MDTSTLGMVLPSSGKTWKHYTLAWHRGPFLVAIYQFTDQFTDLLFILFSLDLILKLFVKTRHLYGVAVHQISKRACMVPQYGKHGNTAVAY